MSGIWRDFVEVLDHLLLAKYYDFYYYYGHISLLAHIIAKYH